MDSTMTDYRLYHGDCLVEMPFEVESNSVDMILCDLPYGTTACAWDSIIPLDALWTEYRRVAKPNAAIVLTASQPFTSVLVSSALDLFRYDLVWHKNKASGHLNAKVAPLRAHESILVFGKKRVPYTPQKTTGHKPGNRATRKTQSEVYGKHTKENTWGGTTERYPRSVLDFAVVNNDSKSRVHPTQKPVAMMEYLIRTYTKLGDVVLDNCMGSGTTGEACGNTRRKFIGIEKEENFFNLASDRTRLAYERTSDGFDD